MSEKFFADNLLSIGDRIGLLVFADAGSTVRDDFVIAGIYEHFPTVYEDEVVVVGNMDYLFSYFPVVMPHNIWLRLQPGANSADVLADIPEVTGVDTIRTVGADVALTAQRAWQLCCNTINRFLNYT